MPPSSKLLPAPSWELLLHPEKDAQYIFFENANQRSNQNAFLFAADSFEKVNAWWLADSSLLAYRGGDFARGAFSAAGLDESRYTFLDQGSTQCHVAGNKEFTIVAFRGTQPEEPIKGFRRYGDLIDDGAFLLKPLDNGRMVHSGFLAALDRIWEKLFDVLKSAETDFGAEHRFWFTGHSLGAALATLAADRFLNTHGVYTIGSPRVGNKQFCRAFDARFAGRSFRHVNGDDIITHVPFDGLLGYSHIVQGKCIPDDVGGNIDDEQPIGLIDSLKTIVRIRFDQFKTSLQQANLSKATLPKYLLDHTPRRYAVNIWNDYAKKAPDVS